MTSGHRGWILATVLGACTTVEPAPVDPPAPPPNAQTEVAVESETVESKGDAERLSLVGVVYEGGRRVCNDVGEETWYAQYWAVGFVPLVHDAAVGKSLASLEGRIVKATGSVVTASATTHGVENPPPWGRMCPEMQMRSDWEVWPKGIRSRRGDEPSVGTLRVEEVVAVEPLRAEEKGDEVHFAVTNPFDAPLKDATLVAHYEGCYGKPGTTTQRRPLGTIQPGAELREIPVPRIDVEDRPRGKDHRLSSVRLLGEVNGGVLDLDVRVASLGLTIECPGKGRKSK